MRDFYPSKYDEDDSDNIDVKEMIRTALAVEDQATLIKSKYINNSSKAKVNLLSVPDSLYEKHKTSGTTHSKNAAKPKLTQ